jgi:hypothetical protein
LALVRSGTSPEAVINAFRSATTCPQGAADIGAQLHEGVFE